MAGIYERLGLRPIINATGSLTRVGGTLMPAEVVEAMAEASKAFVKMEELQERAGQLIGEATGAETGYVTSGASAGLALATAACVAGLDVEKMDRLPDTSGMKNEVVIQKAHRNSYDHAVRSIGVHMVEAGYLGFPGRRYLPVANRSRHQRAHGSYPPSYHPGYGRDRSTGRGLPGGPQTRSTGHRGCAAALPPAGNLRRFIAEGADLVTFSGGKAIQGPQPSGILAGRGDLILSVALQHQDMDVHPRTWTYRHLLQTGVLAGPPHNGIGRAMKVGKEEIVGLMTALQLYIQRDHEADQRKWKAQVHKLAQGLSEVAHLTVSEISPTSGGIPSLRLELDERALKKSAYDVVNLLLDGSPRIVVAEGHAGRGLLHINPMTLQEGEEEIVVRRIKEVLTEV